MGEYQKEMERCEGAAAAASEQSDVALGDLGAIIDTIGADNSFGIEAEMSVMKERIAQEWRLPYMAVYSVFAT